VRLNVRLTCAPPFPLPSPTTGTVLEGNDVEGVLCIAQPWPSIARTVYKDHARYLETYMKPYPGTYFTGDGAGRDKDGYIWIKGRVDGQSLPCSTRLSAQVLTMRCAFCRCYQRLGSPTLDRRD
jgi:hypothetical protein